MQSRDLFGLALRILGIWCLYMAGYYTVFVFMKLGNIANTSVPATEDKIMVGYYLFVAFLLLAAADKIVGLVYGAAVVARSPAIPHQAE